MGPALEKAVPYQKTTEDEYKLLNLIVVDIAGDGTYNMDNTFMKQYEPSEVSIDELREKWLSLGFIEGDQMGLELMYAGTMFLVDGKLPCD